jgi:pimeloyl-ACP methyl ester carboxylesterase
MKKRFTCIVVFSAMILHQGCISTTDKTAHNRHFNVFKTKRAENDYKKAYNRTLNYWPIPFEEIKVKTSLGVANVIVSGSKNASPLILLHGLNASSTMWYPNVEAFTKQYRTYAIDFIVEPGKSIPKKGNISKEKIVRWYQEIFDHFKFKNITIVGASKGGWLAILLALEADTNIDRLVLLSPAQAITAIKVKKKVFDNIMFALFPEREKLRDILETLSSNVDQLNQAYIDQFYIASKHAKINKSLVQMTPFSDHELKSIKIPVMLLIGDNDIINNQKGLERARRTFTNIEADTVSNAGHFLSFDKPATINKRVMQFLSKQNQ